jgi:TM2 domain-containing membrane protein YozV
MENATCAHQSKKSRLIALLLCLAIGFVGAHRFYTGKKITALLMLVSLGGFGIWVLYDLILIAFGAFRDKEGNRVSGWFECD